MKISIASGKGGTGKTSISTALALAASDKYRTTLFDLDVEEPNSRFFLDCEQPTQSVMNKLVPRINTDLCTFCGLCVNVCNFNAILKLRQDFIIYDNLCHTCNACAGLCPSDAISMEPVRIGEMNRFKVSANLELIETKMDIGIEQAAPLVKQAVSIANTEYLDVEMQIFDAPPGASCPTVAATKNMDFVLLITEPTKFAFNDMKIAVEMLKSNNCKFAIVINKFDEPLPELDEYCQTEGIDIIERIPLQREIAETYSQGKNSLYYNSILRTKIENILNYIEQVR